MDTLPFYLALFFHLVGLILAFGSVLVTDLFGLLWIFDRVRFPQIVRVSAKTEKFIWIGWGIMILAGLPLLYYKGAIDNLMVVKLFFVVMIGINGVFLHFLHKKLSKYKKGEHVPDVTMFRLTVTLFISQISWWAAIVIGFLHRHVQSIIEWPQMPWLFCLSILAALIAIWAAGERFLKAR